MKVARLMSALVFAVLAMSFVGSTYAQAGDGWSVTLEDEQGGHGVNYIHVLTEGWIRVYRPVGDGDRELLHEIELDRDARAVVRRALNGVPLDDLEDSYAGGEVLSACVRFRFALPGREAVESTMWCGAKIRCLRRVIESVNRFVPRDCRVRGHGSSLF